MTHGVVDQIADNLLTVEIVRAACYVGRLWILRHDYLKLRKKFRLVVVSQEIDVIHPIGYHVHQRNTA